MKKNVTIAIHEEKLAALEMYLPQRRTAAGDLPPNSPNGEKVGTVLQNICFIHL